MAATLAVLCGSAVACGPFFPNDLLADRAGTLLNLPEGSFGFEARRLVPATHPWTVVEHADWLYPQNPVSRDSVEREWWGDRYDRVVALRENGRTQDPDPSALDLPEEVRRYMAGAAAYARNDTDAAARHFASVLELAADERAHYGVWAQYMLGRIAVDEQRTEDAAAAFQATRERVAGGAADPLGLAASSLGDEAKLRLDAGDDIRAIALYAEQAGTGSEFGRTSLLAVARVLMRDDARLDRVLHDPLGQRAVAAYLLTRSGELGLSPYDADVDPRAAQFTPLDPAERIAHVLGVIERAGIDHVAGADRLAALAYRRGRYDLAGALAAHGDDALAWWVRAKLALRAGDADAAAAAYARAAKDFPADETWGVAARDSISGFETIRPQCRVEGERGTLALARGEFVAAMAHLYRAAPEYWDDAAYVGERVLTLAELKAFVDANVHAAPPKPKPDDREAPDGSGILSPAARDAALRALLARRLLRAERFDEAPGYFDDTSLRARAQAYIDTRRAVEHGDRIERAQAWYAAALATREDGMDLLGYELDPDYQVGGGNFEFGYTAPKVETNPALPLPLAGVAEVQRNAASAAQPSQRFHYRFVAAGLAGRAADLLPARSQAFAAVLCNAAGWVLDRDPEAGAKIYRRYVANGPYVGWAASFGRDCPAPDFAGAARRWHAERAAQFKHVMRRALPFAAAAAVMGLLAGGVLFRRRRAGRAG